MQSSYMKIPPSPTRNNPSSSSHGFPAPPLAGGGDDYSDYYAFLRDALASLPSSVPFDMPDGGGGAAAAAAGQKRGRELEGSDGGSPSQSYSYGSSGSSGGGEGGAGKRRRKTVAVAELMTSLAVLEDQERAERREWEAESQRDLALLEANHKERAQAMADYYDYMENHYADADESEGVRAGRARVAVAAAAAAASSSSAVASDGTAASAAAGGSGAGHHQRRLWVKSRSRAWWDGCDHPDFPEEEFRRAFRMGRATFEMICQELRPAVEKEDTMLRAAIPVRQRVAVCIWRLATGEPLRLVSKRFGLGISTCHKLVLEVCAAIKSVLMPKFLQWPADGAAEDAIKARFEAGSGIPNVVGAMYTTHIPIIAPKISVAAYFNKRHTERNQKTSYSITIQGVVDPDGVFTDVCIGWPGSMSDEQVLANSALYQRAESGMLRGQWVVGGSGYPLLDWVLVPYAHQNLTWTQHAFNEKIGEVQRVARDAFARLKGRWKCLQKRTEVKLQDLPGVLGACCVLHNICEMRREEMDPELTFDLVDDDMVPENGLRSVASMQARESIAHNLLHRGLGGTAFF